MHKLTLFGRFVEDLRKSITDVGGKRFRKGDIVFLITGQQDTSQASRYLRIFDESKGTFWYHKSTIARMIASAGGDASSNLIRRKARGGYEFIGAPDSEVSMRVLASAIDRLWDKGDDCLILREALERAEVGPKSALCKNTCMAYEEEYGAGDLSDCVNAMCAGLSGASLVKETYKTLLVAVLLGPAATSLMLGTNAVTPQGMGGGFSKVMDGFSLIQLVEDEHSMLVPANDLGFEMGSVVTIGRDPRDDVAYVPWHAPNVPSYVSGMHVCILPTSDESGWIVKNLSSSNGTTVMHVADSSVRFMRMSGETEPLSPGDELWLAPLPPGEGTFPSYDMGAVLRFEHLYKYVATKPTGGSYATDAGI